MTDQNLAQAIYLKDYQTPNFLIEKTELSIELHPNKTRVTSKLQIRRNSSVQYTGALILSGVNLQLQSVSLDGRVLVPAEYQVDDEQLIVNVPDHCEFSCVTEINPHENTALEGLYLSNGLFCTQCEAEGFRKITYYLDRPDVLSKFTTTIVADKMSYPVLLSNGNKIASGDFDDGRHWATWEDPFRKPAYLFALVAGQLSSVDDTFVTMSGRTIKLQIFVEDKDLDKCDYAMNVLKRAMRWDEEVYGREYDLDIFMIVAVDDFNMGAMENKGLNIFNTSCVLANPKITSDDAFQRVESVVAHEYFHNWSGNRVTCRDWFQLSLKEGFTVFRDQVFSADMNSATVCRIQDVNALLTLQFPEDAGPTAHPVQPPSYIEISNFYTLTIYEKGAEIVRMLHTLLGHHVFRQGSDLYFDRHDGQAVTINDFVQAMEDVSERDLTQFKYWYTQAGTPSLHVSDYYDSAAKTYTLTLKQKLPSTPEADSSQKQPQHIPVAIGLVGSEGCLPLMLKGRKLEEHQQAIETHCVLELTEKEQTFVFQQVNEPPVPSLLRSFSAPVRLVKDYSIDDCLRLLQHDQDGFSRWNAAQQLYVNILNDWQFDYCSNASDENTSGELENVLNSKVVDVLSVLINDTNIDNHLLALLLALPNESFLATTSATVDVEAIHYTRKAMRQMIAGALKELFWSRYQQLNQEESQEQSYTPNAEAIGGRCLKNSLLQYLMLLDDVTVHQTCLQQYRQSNNMTDTMAAFTAIVHSDFASLIETKEQLLTDFYQQWQNEPLVVNQWLSVQASIPSVNNLQCVENLSQHESFTLRNPNKVRALIGTFGANAIAFHRNDGQGYRFFAEQIITLNAINPQIAARLVTPLTRWKRYSTERQQLMKQTLNDILTIDDLSKDVYEIVSKSLSK